MKHNIQRIRQRNLERLITEAGSATALARIANTNSSYLSQVRNQILTQNGTPRGVGNSLAKKLETGMEKPAGWMDEVHPDTDIPPNSHAQESRKKRLPLLSWVDIGKRCDTINEDSPLYETHSYSSPIPCSDDTYVLRVRGISMMPKFNDGDLIFVDPNLEPTHGKYVVMRLAHDQEASLRLLTFEGGRQYLSALNPDWPTPIIEINAEIKICGVVIFKGMTL